MLQNADLVIWVGEDLESFLPTALKCIPEVPAFKDLVISEILLPMQDIAPIPVMTALFKLLIKNYQDSQKAQLLGSLPNKFLYHRRTLDHQQPQEQFLLKSFFLHVFHI